MQQLTRALAAAQGGARGAATDSTTCARKEASSCQQVKGCKAISFLTRLAA